MYQQQPPPMFQQQQQQAPLANWPPGYPGAGAPRG
jgi:hypothetical protein